ncbi:MAG: M23 family metallopeptidase [Desulfobulbaceae bacterium]|nr:M23 family metallopeptidase [Desulfobulbaceae bacterium]
MLNDRQIGQLILEINGKRAGDFKNWFFMPGMGFEDCEKWWGGGGMRVRPHEGVDLCCYEDRKGERLFLSEQTRIPSISSGEIVAICKDFLGHTVFVKNGEEDFGEIIIAYAHIQPYCQLGDFVQTGDPVGEICATTREKILPHLHLSLLLPPPELKYKDLNWQYLNNCKKDIFLNPFCH